MSGDGRIDVKYGNELGMRNAVLSILVLLSFAVSAQHDSCVVLTRINLEGNKVTKPSVIYRELLVKVGDTVGESHFNELMKESRENVLNTSAFNFVDFVVEDDPDVPNGKVLTIKMVERWYVWPVPYMRYADRNLMSWFKGGDASRMSYGFNIECRNLWGLLHKLNLTMIFGYNQKYALTYDVPYLADKQNFGLEASIGYTRDKEVAYATLEDKVYYYKADEGCPHEAFYAYVKPYFRLGCRNRLFLTVRYDDRLFSDTLVSLNPSFGYDGGSRFRYLTLSAVFKNDFRDDHNYPLDGHYLEIEATKIGTGVFNNEPDVFYGKLTADWYTQIYKRLYWASNITAKLSSNVDVPYFLRKGIGYGNDYVRTLDFYVVDAMNFTVFKNNLKFAILRSVTKNIPSINDERFGKIHLALYANLFFDFARTWNVDVAAGTMSRLANEWIFGTGVGIDFVTYYDKVLRLEYGFSGLGESGFFIHFVAPI